MKVIVTGFGAFADYASNPSQEAVNKLPDFVKFDDSSQKAEVAKLILDTCCSEAFEVIENHVKSQRVPYILILSGLADNRDKICLERFALNTRHYRLPDNKGHQWDEDYIHNEAPDALRAKIDLRGLLNHLNEKGFACDISNNAGSFVCNETYFRSLHAWAKDPICKAILFVHLPPYHLYKHTVPNYNELSLLTDTYTMALQEIISFALDRSRLKVIPISE